VNAAPAPMVSVFIVIFFSNKLYLKLWTSCLHKRTNSDFRTYTLAYCLPCQFPSKIYKIEPFVGQTINGQNGII
jgi:hypothetical protein